jgi:hypothetical protein
MASLNGYIKIHRRLLNWGWYSDSVVKDVFLHLILTANFREQEWMGRTIGAGQVVTSYAHLAADLGFTVKQVRTALDKLKKTGEVASQSTNRYTIITLVNWEKYQVCDDTEDKPEGKQEASKGQTEGKQEASKGQQLKNDKKEKKEKKDKKDKKYISADAPEDFFPLDGKLDRTFRDFIRHREQIKQPMTENAVRLMIGKLEKMTTDNNERIMILEESIMNGWKGIFPLKEGQKKQDGNVFLKLAREFAEEEGDGWFENF